MMFSKLSGRPIATHVPSVARPASVSGASVSRTSVARRNVIASRIVIESSAHRPASRNALTIVRLDSWIPTTVPVPSGATCRTAAVKRCSVALSLASPFGKTSMRTRPSGAIQSRLRSAGSVSSVTGSACNAARNWSSVTTRPGISATRARSRAAGSALARIVSAFASRAASVAATPAGCGPAACSSALAVRNIARTISASSGGGFTSSGLSAGSISIAASASSASFGSCCSGTKFASVIARLTSGSVESRFASVTASPCVGASTSIVLGVVSASFMRSSSVATDSARSLRRLMRVEVEREFRHQQQAADGNQRGHGENGDATPCQEAIERRKCRITDLAALAARAHHREQGRQQRDAGDERDDHAGSRDQAQLRHAAIFGGQEGVEPRRRRCARERQRHADFRAGFPQRPLQVVVQVALGAIADAELDAEIDAEADEQHGERHRDQVERADRRRVRTLR